jgi:hypothetical protein
MNQKESFVMIFYSILTYFIGPRLVPLITKNYQDRHIPGFTLGFVLSILLWIKFGKKYSK